MGNLMPRLLYAGLSIPVRLRERAYCANMRRRCLAAAEAELSPQCAIHSAVEREAVRIGKGTQFMGEIIAYAPGGSVNIGKFCFIGPGAKLWSRIGIDIGDNVQISHGAHVFDNNSHSLSASERGARFRELRNHGHHLQDEDVKAAPVRIEDDVWIGFNAAIMRGVTIGKGAVIGACCVVTHDVPSYAVMAENPARQVGTSRP